MVGIRVVGPVVAITILVIVAPSLYLAGCVGRVAPQQAPTPRPLPQLKAVEVRPGDHYFDPKTIVVPAGEAVRLVLKNEGRALHTFTIDELGIIVRLGPGEVREVDVKADRTDNFTRISCLTDPWAKTLEGG